MILNKYLKILFGILTKVIYKKNYIEYCHRKINLKISESATVHNCAFGKYNTIYDGAIVFDTDIGDFSYIGERTKVNCASIGKFCCIGPGCRIGLGRHPHKIFVSTHPAFYSNRMQAQVSFTGVNLFDEVQRIAVGNDVWIGANAVLTDGICVGNGAIIGAGAVVTKNIPPYAIAVGVPARIIKYRFMPREISFLEKFKWWNRDVEWLRNNYKDFCNIKAFMKKYGSSIHR